MELKKHKHNWWAVYSPPAEVIEYLRRSVPPDFRFFDTETGLWYVHDSHVVPVRQFTTPTTSPGTDLYAVLHLLPSAPVELVKAAWRLLAKQYHPDYGGDTEQFIQLKRAYDAIIEDVNDR